ncbi:MAG: UDP-N-acetylmuramate dehydrogenase [Bacilli bacterium]|nr:UDP-N-acetylmuramate dehydrogenase [Bacilli bacterium]
MIKDLQNFGKVLESVSLKNYNTYKIGGLAKYLIHPSDKENLIALIKYLKENEIKFFVLGNGSNLIFSDNLYDGVIIKLDNLNKISFDGTKVIAEAGVMLPKVAIESINHGLKGLEWATGIPGTIGGSTVGNAGAYKSCMFDFIDSVTVLDENSEVKVLKKDDITYKYRHTNFKDNKNIIILDVVMNLEYGDKEESLEKVKKRLEKRKETQPLDYPSAGSVFRNPEGDASGRIIEQEVGLKGKTIGGAKVSEKHANFIINIGNATGKDVKDLINLVHDEVLKKCGIDLIPEQEFVNWE